MTEVIDKILNGNDLCISMSPDDAIPTNAPLHDESFELNHITVAGDCFVGSTACDFVTSHNAGPSSFYYSNRGIFGTFSSVDCYLLSNKENRRVIPFTFSSINRYKEYTWIVRDRYELIWDSLKKDNDFETLRAATRASRKLKAVFCDNENIWNIHPVMIAQIERYKDNFVLKTHNTIYPELFRKNNELDAFIAANAEYLNDKRRYREGLLGCEGVPFVATYHFFQDGSYKSFYDLSEKKGARGARHIKIYVERNS